MVRLEMFFTAFEKIYSGFRFSLRSFRLACSLRMRSIVWIWTISVSLLIIGQFLEIAWWSFSAVAASESVLVHLSIRYCFTESFHFVSISKTCLATHWSFIIFVSICFCFFLRGFFEYRWFFFFERE